jgi:hypothetical protein
MLSPSGEETPLEALLATPWGDVGFAPVIGQAEIIA